MAAMFRRGNVGLDGKSDARFLIPILLFSRKPLSMSELACFRQPRSEHREITTVLLWTTQRSGDTFGMRKGIEL